MRAGYQYVPIINYEYRYEDKTYNSSRRRAGNYVSGRLDEAEAVGSRYPVGSTVKVFVNPENPTVSALEFGTTPLSWICIVLGLLLAALATLGLLNS